MTIYKFQTTLEWSADAYSGPVSMNQIFVETTEANPLDQAVGVCNALTTFYGAVKAYLPASIFSGEGTIEVFDLADPKPRQPRLIVPLDLSPMAGNSNLPTEVAVCISYRAARVAGVTPQRRRGRFYLGPLTPSTLAGDGRMYNSVLDGLAQITQQLWEDISELGSSEWVCGSEEHGFFPIVQFLINNEFDTIRRRQSDPTYSARWNPTTV